MRRPIIALYFLCSIAAVSFADEADIVADINPEFLKSLGWRTTQKIESRPWGSVHVRGPRVFVLDMYHNNTQGYELSLEWTWDPNSFASPKDISFEEMARKWKETKTDRSHWMLSLSQGTYAGRMLLSGIPLSSDRKEGGYDQSLLTFCQLLEKMLKWAEIAKANRVGSYTKTIVEGERSAQRMRYVDFRVDTTGTVTGDVNKVYAALDFGGITISSNDVPAIMHFLQGNDKLRIMVTEKIDKWLEPTLMKIGKETSDKKKLDALFQ